MGNENRPHFLVGFDPSSSSESLELPYKFANLICAEVPGRASLLGPSGHTWHANIVQQNGDLCFQNGWATFVRDNSLELGDSLVFRYDGNLHFSILIFDQSKCQKEAAFISECSHDSIKMKRDRENPAPLNCILEAIPKRLRSALVPAEYIGMATSSQPDRTSYLFASECLNTETCAQLDRDWANKKGFPEEVNCMVRQSGEARLLAEQKDVGCILRNSVTIAVPSSEYVEIADSKSATVNRAEKEEELLSSYEAERVAQSFTSSFPNFTKVMKRFNVSGSYTLNIPYQFATAHLPKCKVKIVLRNTRGESWTINSVPTIRVQTSHTFCGGWLSFVRDNDISVGDVCFFELVGQCEFRVQVIRVMKEAMVDCNDNQMHKAMPSSSCKVQNKIFGSKTENRNTNHYNKPLEWSECAVKSFSPSSWSESRELVVWEGSSPAKLASPTKGCVSLKSGPEEKLAAQSFLSIFPHFVRIMKKFNVSGSYTLKIPYQFSMKHLPNCRTEITLRNLKGKRWTVNSITTTKVQTLHTFCGGWMSFVRENNIQMGDICIFELVGEHEMRVHVCGPGKNGLSHHHSERASSNETGA